VSPSLKAVSLFRQSIGVFFAVAALPLPEGAVLAKLRAMSSTALTVVALIKAKPGQEENLREALLNLIPTTRAEEGCLNYDLHRSMEEPGAFLFHENWTSKEALDAHLAKPHLREFLGRADELLAEPPQITLWEKIG
jgi:quinol monooxygenase YgiN